MVDKKAEKKEPKGRPKDPFIPWEKWKKDIISLYAEGASDVEIRGLICDKMEGRTSCTYYLWDRWLKDEPDFLETIKIGRQQCEIWWQQQGRTNLKNKEFSPALWFINMKNRFKWCDKPEKSDDSDDIIKPLKVVIEVADASRNKG